MRSFFKTLILVAVSVCATAAFAAGPDTLPDGSINFGSASNFSVLTWGDYSQINNTFTGPSEVRAAQGEANVGIGGRGNFSMSDGTIYGKLYMNKYGKFTKSGPAVVTGGVEQDDSSDALVSAGLMDAAMLAMTAANEMSSSNLLYYVNSPTNHQTVTTVRTGKSMTIGDSSAYGNPFGGQKIVLNLQDFVLTGGTFTLAGGARTTFIINVARNFSLNNSSVILSGGLLASHVLFNVTNKESTDQVSLNQGTHLYGNLLAMGRKVSLSGGRVHGRAFANQVAITSGGGVISE